MEIPEKQLFGSHKSSARLEAPVLLDGNLTSTIMEVGQDKDLYELISASKMISFCQLLREPAQICTNDRLLIPFMIVGIRVFA